MTTILGPDGKPISQVTPETVTRRYDSDAYKKAVYARESWCRAATQIIAQHGRRSTVREVEFMYRHSIYSAIHSGVGLQEYLRHALVALDQVAEEVFPPLVETPDEPVRRLSRADRRRQARDKGARELREREIINMFNMMEPLRAEQSAQAAPESEPAPIESPSIPPATIE